MPRRVWACDRCGEEWDQTWDGDACTLCGGTVEEVDPLLVATADAFAALACDGIADSGGSDD